MTKQKMTGQAKILFLILLCYLFGSMCANAQSLTKVCGSIMYPSKDIVINAVRSKYHTTLLAAVKTTAGLVETLQSKGSKGK